MPREGETLPGRAQQIGMWQNSDERWWRILGDGGEYTPRPSLIVVVRGDGTDYKHVPTGVRAAGGTCWLPFFRR